MPHLLYNWRNMNDELLQNKDYQMFHHDWKQQIMFVPKKLFDELASMFLDHYPVGGSAAFRRADGKRGVLINWDLFTSRFGENFQDIVDIEVEHEIFEMWLTRNRPLDEKYDFHDPCHYQAIEHALDFAKSHGLLDKNMKFKRTMFHAFDQKGDTFALKELAFYEDYISK